MKIFLSVAALSLVALTASFAQSTMPATNPLKPAAPAITAPAKPAVMPAVEKKADDAAKPKRERSAKQKANDDLMRKCGAERRAEVAAGKKDVLPWLKYLPECRKRNPIS
jgi:hypothetical protein